MTYCWTFLSKRLIELMSSITENYETIIIIIVIIIIAIEKSHVNFYQPI